MEVWHVESSAEFQEALWKGLEWFNGWVSKGDRIPDHATAKRLGVSNKNPMRDVLKGCKLKVHLDRELSVRPPI